uniref:Schlafen family member 14 n=1 Tax=Callorhinchus milii TaxID=7868 RepID=A0A4W3JM30_CALMI
MDRGNVRVIENDYPDLVVDIGEAVLGEKQRKKMKNNRELEKQNIIKAACGLINSGGGIITLRVRNEMYKYENDGTGLDITEGLHNLVKPENLSEFFEFLQQDKSLLIFVKSWTGRTDQNGKLPRLCTIKCNVYQREQARNLHLSTMEVDHFLNKRKKFVQSRQGPEVRGNDVAIMELAKVVFEKAKSKCPFKSGVKLSVAESKHVEYKEFSSSLNLTKMKEKLYECISAFANAEGGFLFFGVDDESKVVGCANDFPNCDAVHEKIAEMLEHSLISYPSEENYVEFHVAEVLEELKCIGYLIAFRVKPCYVTFAHKPECWKIEDKEIKSLEPNEWLEMMTATDPGKYKVIFIVKNVYLVIISCVLNKAGRLDKLQNKLFKVNRDELKHMPDDLYQDLSQEYPGLRNVVPEMKPSGSVGLLIFSRSWAVDIDLPKSPDIICDALLIATNNTPVLYTVAKQKNNEVLQHSKKTAFNLKQKIVNVGGYAGKLCVIPKILQYPSEENSDTSVEETEDESIQYPHSYLLGHSTTVQDVLKALTIVLLNFRSFLSYDLSCEFLSLLTIEQFNILHSRFNIEKCKKLFIHGLPGTGKTIIAMQLIERIRNTFNCESHEILYICENQPLRNFIQQRDLCTCVTRTTFIKEDPFNKVKHIIADEAQNFRAESPNWYDKAEGIRKNPHTHPNGPGVFWIFMDYFQTSHTSETGLPNINEQDPETELTVIVRNAKRIHKFARKAMEQIIEIQFGQSDRQHAVHLRNLLDASACVHSFPGMLYIEECETRHAIVQYIATKIKDYLKNGYAKKQIAILCSTKADSEFYKPQLEKQLRKIRPIVSLGTADGAPCDWIVLDSIRRFSGLERSIIFGINPKAHASQHEIEPNLMVCLASRAMAQLHLCIF